MRAIYMKEIRSYFKGPLGYVFIGLILAIFGIYYSIYTLYPQMGYSEYGTILQSAMGLMVYILPLLTMRAFSEEMKNRTDQLLLTAPVRTWQIVLGKYLAALTVLAIALLITVLQPLTTAIGYDGDIGIAKTLGGYIGTFLMTSAIVSVGMWISSMTENQLIAFVLTIAVVIFEGLLGGIGDALPSETKLTSLVLLVVLAVVVFLLYRAMHNIFICSIIGGTGLIAIVIMTIWPPSQYAGWIAAALNWLDLMSRCGKVFTGYFNFSQIVFFITFSAFFLFLTIQVLEKKRWN